MASRPRSIWFVVFLSVIALAGLTMVQVYLLNDAFQLKEQAFERNVLAALGAASRRLETGDALSRVFRVEGALPGAGTRMVQTEVRTISPDRRGSRDSTFFVRQLPRPAPVRVEGNSFYYHIATPQRVRMRLLDEAGRDSVIVDTLKPAGEHVFTFSTGMVGRGNALYRFTTDSVALVVQVADGKPGPLLRAPASEMERAVFVSRVMDNLWTSEGEPLERRLRPATLDSVVRLSMKEAGIPLDFAYGVIAARKDTVLLARPADAAGDLRRSELRTPLFLLDPLGPRTELAVHFPGRSVYIVRQLWPALLASAVFLVLIVVTFGYSIRTIMTQQRLARLMVDFINNMTHEFKTPISTVALASEAIRRPDVVTQKMKVLKYSTMIAEETSRMKKQVDRILQMAQMERGDYELSIADVDLHELIRAAAGSFALQVETRGGHITLALRASHPVIPGDAVHLSNIIHNILDNANKYSPSAPEITVATEDEATMLVLKVADRGSGIPDEHQKRVFDTYYRVPTGNVHAVKGFGIGLSYVKLLVEAHGGKIALKSEPGAGTEIAIRLPVRK